MTTLYPTATVTELTPLSGSVGRICQVRQVHQQQATMRMPWAWSLQVLSAAGAAARAAPDTTSCTTALQTLCGAQRANRANCGMCVNGNAAKLLQAGCTEKTIGAWCGGASPPAPPSSQTQYLIATSSNTCIQIPVVMKNESIFCHGPYPRAEIGSGFLQDWVAGKGSCKEQGPGALGAHSDTDSPTACASRRVTPALYVLLVRQASTMVLKTTLLMPPARRTCTNVILKTGTLIICSR